MISGFDRYFQIVRCFRDEDLRADRQPEFTQIDLEMTFPQIHHIFTVTEAFLSAAFKTSGHPLQTPFPQMTYDQAIRHYGSDKPDLRLPALTEVRSAFGPAEVAKLAVDPQLPIVAIRIPNVGELSRKERDDIKPLFAIKDNGAKLFEDFSRLERTFPESMAKVRELSEAQPGDLVVLVAGTQPAGSDAAEERATPVVTPHEANVYMAAGALRVVLAQKYAQRHGRFGPATSAFFG